MMMRGVPVALLQRSHHCPRRLLSGSVALPGSPPSPPEIVRIAAALEGSESAQQAVLLALSPAARMSMAVQATSVATITCDAEAAVLAAAARKSADGDGDGMISRREFSKWVIAAGEQAGERAAAAGAAVAQPSNRQLACLGLNAAVPFVGFGLLDNSIMILAGDAIDASLGAKLGFSMMASAALGNMVSDVAGIGLGGVVETVAVKAGMPQPAPRLTVAQQQLLSTKAVSAVAGAVGISVGCVLGMFPLLLIDYDEQERRRRLQEVFSRIDTKKSGTIDVAELGVALDRFGLDVSKASVDKLMQK